MQDSGHYPLWGGDINLTAPESRYLNELNKVSWKYHAIMQEIANLLIAAKDTNPDSLKINAYAETIVNSLDIATKISLWLGGNKTLGRFPDSHAELSMAKDLAFVGRDLCAMMKRQYEDIARRTSLLFGLPPHDEPIQYAQKVVEELFRLLEDALIALNIDTGEVNGEKLDFALGLR